jgi:hypothetical protein
MHAAPTHSDFQRIICATPSRSHRVSWAIALLVLLAGASGAHAGGNIGAVGYLTWNATDKNATDLASPGVVNNLYVYIERSGGLSFKGAELDLTWNPLGAPDGTCYAHSGTTFKTSSGTTCTYLNRDTAVPVTTADEAGHLHVAWANTAPLTSCSSGSIIQIQFEFDGCTDPRGCFTLNSLTLLDNTNEQDAATVAGPRATVNGGLDRCGTQSVHVYYVDQASPCTSCDGLSWRTAVHRISEALAKVNPAGRDSVLVAQGTYRETGLMPPANTALVGGYATSGGPRDVSRHPSVVAFQSGSTTGGLLSLASSGVVVDGFTLTGIMNGGPQVVLGSAAHDTLRWVTIKDNCCAAQALRFTGTATDNLLDRCIIAKNMTMSNNSLIVVDAHGSVHFEDCDVTQNSTRATNGTPGVFANGRVVVRNTIMWDLRPAWLPPISVGIEGSADVSYSDLPIAWPGTGNIVGNPRFCNAPKGIYTLQSNSPCIGAGHDRTTIGALESGCGPAGSPSPSPGVTSLAAANTPQGVEIMRSADGTMAIRFALNEDAPVRVEVFRVTGERVALVHDGVLEVGTHTLIWNLASGGGRKTPAGVYMVRVTTPHGVQSARSVITP